MLPHPSEARMGHPFFCGANATRRKCRSFGSFACGELAQDDNSWGGLGWCYPTLAKLGWGTPALCWIETGGLRFVVSHPSEAWMGHPFLCWIEKGGLRFVLRRRGRADLDKNIGAFAVANAPMLGGGVKGYKSHRN